MKINLLFLYLFSCWSGVLLAQTGSINGHISSKNESVPFASIGLLDTSMGTSSDNEGNFLLENIPFGEYQLKISLLGYKSYTQNIHISPSNPDIIIKVDMEESSLTLDQVVVTGTRTARKRVNSPVIVDVIDKVVLENTQSVSLSEGLKYQTGLRVETDCQTCNYTQIRLNGLQGGYSQVLINNRPIFSPLTGLYGLEQIPSNMIDRIEVIRGGGSALYGPGAVGGTVNVITKSPSSSSYEIGYNRQVIQGAAENILTGNGTLVSKNNKMGATFFVNKRDREWWDANGDNYSELPKISGNALGVSLFYQPTSNQKLNLSYSNLNEYRYGGEMVNSPAHLTQQSEERDHDISFLNIDYKLNINKKTEIALYGGMQNTFRTHYTGILPDDDIELSEHYESPPYGLSENISMQTGIQVNRDISKTLPGEALLTFGTEYNRDEIYDVIEAYSFLVDQETENMGFFLQNDWEPTEDFTILSGVRLDNHNFVDRPIVSPRVSLLYSVGENTQIRGTWGTGFRPPQAFDSDLHIAFAGGGVSRVMLAEDLKHERSNSFSGSLNYDKPLEKVIWGFTVEGFYTYLRDVFYLNPIGEDAFGEVFVKTNGTGASVQGASLDFRVNYDEKVQFDGGFTLQNSLFDSPIQNSDVLSERREFMRTPNDYGYGTFSFFPKEQWDISANATYTGSMVLVHFAGSPEQAEDSYVNTDRFFDVGIRASYRIPVRNTGSEIELFSGFKNILNAYQADFDTGKNRDSNYVYGPATPRMLFFGLKLKSN